MSSSSTSSFSAVVRRGVKRARNGKRKQNKRAVPIQSHVIVYNYDMSTRAPMDIDFPLAGSYSNQVYNITQSFETINVFTTSTTVPTSFNTSFNFGQLDQNASLATVFDQYRIRRIEAKFYPTAFGGTGVQLGVSAGLLTSVIDYDDAATVTVAQANDYQNALIVPVGTAFARTFVPHVALAAYSGSVFTQFANAYDQWIDANSTGVPHYGIKVATSITDVAVQYSMVVKMWIQLKNVR
jgi:hypothetical protein